MSGANPEVFAQGWEKRELDELYKEKVKTFEPLIQSYTEDYGFDRESDPLILEIDRQLVEIQRAPRRHPDISLAGAVYFAAGQRRISRAKRLAFGVAVVDAHINLFGNEYQDKGVIAEVIDDTAHWLMDQEPHLQVGKNRFLLPFGKSLKQYKRDLWLLSKDGGNLNLKSFLFPEHQPA